MFILNRYIFLLIIFSGTGEFVYVLIDHIDRGYLYKSYLAKYFCVCVFQF